jgi:hypothetical protein
MLSISDLHNEQELSSLRMRKVAGGEEPSNCDKGALFEAAGAICNDLGLNDAAGWCYGTAEDFYYQGGNCR